MESPILKAVLSHYYAEKDKALAKIDGYLNHSQNDIDKAIKETIIAFEELEKSYSVIEVIKNTIKDNESEKQEIK